MTWRQLVAGFWHQFGLGRGNPPEPAAPEQQADLVEVHKAGRRLELRREGRVLKTYRVALGFAPERHKEREGDGRTPEGAYVIDARNPKSSFHLSLRVSYPDERDKAHAASLGVSPGGDIYIHGQPNGPRKFLVGHPVKDWTTGCVAVADAEMREIWSLVPTGVRVVIHP
nr:L,D-transpeptidase family protein [Reyranella sp.]